MRETAISRRSLLEAAGAVGVAALAATSGAASAAPAGSGLVDPATPRHARPRTESPHTRLVFSDEFDNAKLDTARWNLLDYDRGTQSDGIDYWYKAANVHLTRGALAIDISKLGTNSYGGGRVDTQGKFDFTFGTIEYRMHIPPTQGHLAAAWLQATNGLTPGGVVDGTARDGAEIDVIESFSTADEYAVTIHWDGYGAAHQSSSLTLAAPGLHDGAWYHTFTTVWTPDRLSFYYDGTLARDVTDPILISQVDEFAIASHEVIPFAQGDIADAPLNATSRMYVDYVRVWQ